MNVFVLSERRTGSNLLITSLAQVPELIECGELFNSEQHPELTSMATEDVLPWAQSVLSEVDGPHVLAKIQPEQLDGFDLTVEDFIDAFPGALYVVLYREDLFDQYVSFIRAQRSGDWISRPGDESPPNDYNSPIQVDPDAFRSFARRSADRYRHILEILADRNANHTVIRYRDVADRIADVVRLIATPLGINAPAVEHRLVKQNRIPHVRGVANFMTLSPLLKEGWARHEFPSAIDQLAGEPLTASPPASTTTYERFVVLFTARSGSTFLMHLLNTRSDVFCEDEIFARENLPEGASQMELLRDFYLAPQESDLAFLGCKIKASDISDRGAFCEMVRELDISVITLTRRNVARRAISFLRGEELYKRSGHWNLRNEASLPVEALRIDPDRFVALVQQFAKQDGYLGQLANRTERPVLGLWYEHLESHLQAELERIALFLRLPVPFFAPKDVGVSKHTHFDLSLSVLNVGELHQALIGTGFAWCLQQYAPQGAPS